MLSKRTPVNVSCSILSKRKGRMKDEVHKFHPTHLLHNHIPLFIPRFHRPFGTTRFNTRLILSAFFLIKHFKMSPQPIYYTTVYPIILFSKPSVAFVILSFHPPLFTNFIFDPLRAFFLVFPSISRGINALISIPDNLSSLGLLSLMRPPFPFPNPTRNSIELSNPIYTPAYSLNTPIPPRRILFPLLNYHSDSLPLSHSWFITFWTVLSTLSHLLICYLFTGYSWLNLGISENKCMYIYKTLHFFIKITYKHSNPK